jgi:hypothetical protein
VTAALRHCSLVACQPQHHWRSMEECAFNSVSTTLRNCRGRSHHTLERYVDLTTCQTKSRVMVHGFPMFTTVWGIRLSIPRSISRQREPRVRFLHFPAWIISSHQHSFCW